MSFLALFVEENFATAEFINSPAQNSASSSKKEEKLSTSQKTWYLPKESLKVGLSNYCKDRKIEKVFLIDRFTKKILKFRLGGSVAVITTPGMGRAHELTMQGQVDDSRLRPELKPSLSSEELRFEILETDNLISEIEPKLKLMGCKRVFIHHPNLSATSEPVKNLQQLGYEVLVEKYPAPLETLRSKILGLSIQGTLEDLYKDIHESLGDECEILWCSLAGFRKNDPHLRSSFLQAWPRIENSTLMIGWDHCYLLQPNGESKILSTGLGSVFDFESSSYRWGNNEGLEPGPLCFGRGQKLLALDLLVNSLPEGTWPGELIQKEKFETKYKAVWKVCQKFHPKSNQSEIKKEWLVQLIAESKVLAGADTLHLTGPALKILINEFSLDFFKKIPNLKIDAESSLARFVSSSAQLQEHL